MARTMTDAFNRTCDADYISRDFDAAVSPSGCAERLTRRREQNGFVRPARAVHRFAGIDFGAGAQRKNGAKKVR